MTSPSDPSAGLSPIPAGRYRLDPAQCAVRADVKAMFGLLTVHGTFKILSGEVVIADNLADSSVTAVLDAGSFISGNAKRDRDVTSAGLLDAATYPEIAFVSDNVRRDQADWVITGQLSAHGTSVATELRVDRATLNDGVAPSTAPPASNAPTSGSPTRREWSGPPPPSPSTR